MADDRKVGVILGAQWGDEGKGKLVDVVAADYDIVARCAGGANAGHTIVANGIKYALHLVPSGIITENAVCLIGNGVVLHVPSLFSELEDLKKKGVKLEGRIKISDRAHLLFECHKVADQMGEDELSGAGNKQIGTTKQGIGPCYADKASRLNLRVGDLRFIDQKFKPALERLVETKKKRFGDFSYDIDGEVAKYKEYAKQLEPFIVDGVEYLNTAYAEGKKILVEGANAALLDIDFGTYPYVTSSNCTVGGVFTGLGLSFEKVGRVYGVVKAFTTRVGQGPFPTELSYEDTKEGKILVDIGKEFGTTTGRRRRVGWLDLMILKYSMILNGYTHLNLTKLDVLDTFEEIKIAVGYNYNGKPLASFPANLEVLGDVEVQYQTLPGWNSSIADCRKYEELPRACRTYIERIEQLVGSKFAWIGVGPAREAMISRDV